MCVREEQLHVDICTDRQQSDISFDNLALPEAQGITCNTSDTELKITHGMKSIVHFFVKQLQILVIMNQQFYPGQTK